MNSALKNCDLGFLLEIIGSEQRTFCDGRFICATKCSNLST